ncbi:hypothetical protein [Phaeacidiphilus oryzae]|uniref:hypothetical protein n=1 Tax=Phaeacidiphilus oryzae TaxID=348818 RepID=UPI00056B03AC|nr:hypothetical protein [Phaeacidiphilus oryzae]
MHTVAVTGHMDLSPSSEAPVAAELRALLEALVAEGGGEPLYGLSCLAPGADTLFAEAVLDTGGELEVVLPFHDYGACFADPLERARFDHLLKSAITVAEMPYSGPELAAFEAANTELVKRADLLVAVWNGRPSEKGGGTAAAVAEAHRLGVPVRVVWPAGARRDG